MKKIIFILTMIIVFPLGVNAMEMDNVTNETYYVKSEIDYDINGNILNYDDFYITEDEYNTNEENAILYSNNGSVSHETTYKKIEVSLSQINDNVVECATTLTWKKLPKVRSYDFIAHRYENLSSIYHFAELSYKKGNQTTILTINSDYNSHLIRSFGNGWVAAFELPEGNDVEDLTVYSEQRFLVSQNGKIYSTYQHATKDTTYQNILNTASISASGLGGVLQLGNVVSGNFDQMKGVSINVTY